MHHIAVIAVPPVTSFDIAVPSMIFGNVRIEGAPGYAVRVCALQPGNIATSDSVGLTVRWGLRILKDADTVIVTGAGSREILDSRLLSALQRAHQSSKRVASICTGAFALAQSGILDGRRATTYWLYSEEFRRRFAAVDLRPDGGCSSRTGTW